MRLYHYAKAETEAAILRQGIMKGGIPTQRDGRIGLIDGWQWLTASPDWGQGWAAHRLTNHDRTAIRFTVVIPKSARDRLFPWAAVALTLFSEDALRGFHDTGDDPRDWYVFNGRIPPAWIRRVERWPASAPLPIREIA